MELIYNNQLSILIDVLPLYLTQKHCILLYSSNNKYYNIYLNNNKFESIYNTLKYWIELKEADYYLTKYNIKRINNLNK